MIDKRYISGQLRLQGSGLLADPAVSEAPYRAFGVKIEFDVWEVLSRMLDHVPGESCPVDAHNTIRIGRHRRPLDAKASSLSAEEEDGALFSSGHQLSGPPHQLVPCSR